MDQRKWQFVMNEWRHSLPAVIAGDDPLDDERNFAAYANICADLDDQDQGEAFDQAA